MPIVQTPDGSVVQFPDDMPEADINAALAKQYPATGKGEADSTEVSSSTPQYNGFGRVPLGFAERALGGFEDFVGLPGTAAKASNDAWQSLPPQTGINGALQATNQALSSFNPMRLWPSGEQLNRWTQAGLGAVGIPTIDRLAPRDQWESQGQALAEAAGGAALPVAGEYKTGLAIGKAAALKAAAAMGVSSLGGASAAQAARDNLDPGISRYVAPAAELGAGLVGAGMSHSIEAGNKISGLRNSLDEATANAIDATKLQENAKLYAEADSKGMAANARGEGDAAQQAIADRQAQSLAGAQSLHSERNAWADSTEQAIADAHSALQDTANAGAASQRAVQTWLDNPATEPGMRQQLETIAGPLNAKIPGDTATPLNNFTNYIKTINPKSGSLSGFSEPLTSPLAKTYQGLIARAEDARSKAKELEEVAGPGASGGVADAPLPGEAATWDEARQLRSEIGSALADPKGRLAAGIPTSQLEGLYSSLTSDLERTANGAGAGQEFKDYNTGAKALYDTARGPVSQLLQARQPGEGLAALIASGKKDGSWMQMLRDNIPVGADGSHPLNDAAAAMLNRGSGTLNWEDLHPNAQAAMVPDAMHRAALNAAGEARAFADSDLDAAQARIKGAAKADTADAKASTKASLDAIQGRATEGVRMGNDAAADAKKKLALAQQFYSEATQPSVASRLDNINSRIGSAVAGSSIGGVPLMSHVFGDYNKLAAGALGFALPKAARGIVATAKNPSLLRFPALNALGAAPSAAPSGPKE